MQRKPGEDACQVPRQSVEPDDYSGIQPRVGEINSRATFNVRSVEQIGSEAMGQVSGQSVAENSDLSVEETKLDEIDEKFPDNFKEKSLL